MTEDPTLSDFQPDSGADAGELGADAGETGADAGEPDADPDLPAYTYGWGAYTCAVCGEATERVWRAEAGLVCPACKPW